MNTAMILRTLLSFNFNFKGTIYLKAFMVRDLDGHAELVTN